jgi:hypothetical protein
MMKRHPFAIAMIASLSIAACAGAITRTKVVLPALAGTWHRIRVDIDAQLHAEPNPVTLAQLAMADAALATDDPLRAAAVDWRGLLAAADAGIAKQVAAGTLPEIAAGSFRERLAQFQMTIDTYNRKGAQ